MSKDGKGKSGTGDTSALLDIISGTITGSLDELYDLSKLPRKMMEIERKYRLTPEDGNVDLAMTDFMARFGKFQKDQKIAIEKLTPFAGIDQYFIIKKGKNESIFRYRVGVNRPPQLTTKFQVIRGSNLIRGEINLNIRYEEPEKVRAFMAVICGLADSYQIFGITQSGNIWITKSPEGSLVEVVVYKVSRITPPEKLEAFVEIEPLNSKNIPGIIETIEKYEKALQLSDSICEESIAELFRER